MNATSARRRSIYCFDGPLTGSQAGLPLRGPRPISRSVSTDSSTDNDNKRRRTFVPVQYAEYSAQCRAEKDAVYSESIFTVELLPEPPGIREQIDRMFTIFPWRDANWVIAIALVVGSILFLVNAILGLAVVLDPASAFPGESELAIPLTGLGGAALFLILSVFSLAASWNVEHGTLNKKPKPISSSASFSSTAAGVQESVRIYRPAMLGSKAWVWLPSWELLVRLLLRDVPFQSAFAQFIGTCILCVSIGGGWPGVLAPEDLPDLQLLLFGPLAVGGMMLFLANLGLLLWLQDVWWRPKFVSASWQASLWAVLGSAGFSLSGFMLFLGSGLIAAVVLVTGSAAFLLAAVVQWYDTMAFYPNEWAA